MGTQFLLRSDENCHISIPAENDKAVYEKSTFLNGGLLGSKYWHGLMFIIYQHMHK
jgi:hypothetical protein